MTFKADTSKFNSDVNRMLAELKIAAPIATRFAAGRLVLDAKKRAPENIRELKGSGFTERPKGGGSNFSVGFGFKSSHARVMDTGFKVRFIRPRRAKALFIPKTKRAARIRAAGRLGPGSGLRKGIDFDFVSKPIRSAGKPVRRRRKGPNLYFSETIKQHTGKRSKISRNISVMLGKLVSRKF